MYIVVLALISPDFTYDVLMVLAGAFSFAWIVGFITIGAPGGIGIRESIMLGMTNDVYAEKVIIFVLVMRVSSILADLFSFLLSKIIPSSKNACLRM